jgi:gluconokinase
LEDVNELVVGVDIGTTSTKAIAYDVSGRVVASHAVACPLREPRPGYAEQDPQEILTAVLQTISRIAARCGGQVRALSFSSAMHGLIGLDSHGSPLTPVITWADQRASAQAERMHTSAGGLALHRRTGTPLHASAPLPKLAWFGEEEPELAARVRYWAGIKDYVLSQLTGVLVTDHSMASATGLLDIHQLRWDPEGLQLAGISADQLPELVPTTTVLPGLLESTARAAGLAPTTPLVVGAGDGPLASLGLGAVRPGTAACSIGTSGALRVTVEYPVVDEKGRTFCYALTDRRWVTGGAISNGGLVLDWCGDALAPEPGGQRADELLRQAADMPPGCGGLIMLPYLHSERAPHWTSLPRGAYIGLTSEHRRGHLIRAALEGVCQQLRLVLESVCASGNEVHAIRATGGFARSALWRHMLADVLAMPVGFARSHEASSFGAALLGMQALGLIDSLDAAASLVEIHETIVPDPAAQQAYASLRPVFEALYDALIPTFQALRQLKPHLPIDYPEADRIEAERHQRAGPR